ncbi:hypothetical protein DOTSEDRAFT_52492 [Dothistroma septosporum NZE10]|uniref:Chromo domain-containing protein n=1 Tax=Dothistroma septosporum (strain NZE10 / CBS 128990) TaxID=675120 RepID=N1PQB6_DOTSN|nr:hypothetical protein DOTSEDRAFT_52492 [Dothistroma septosporum NZE10]
MPPITGLTIPVYRASESPECPRQSLSAKSVKLRNQPRIYQDGPLPIKLSDHAPRQARITGRVATPDKVAYTIEIGGVIMNDVGIDEILDYVSPFELERFETQQFVEEIEIDRIAQEAADAEAEHKREQQKIRAQHKGIAIFQDLYEDSMEVDAESVDAGKYGRARPTYKHLFKKMKERRRRRRDPLTGELMLLSGDENEEAADLESSSGGEQAAMPSSTHMGLPEPAKRRRRKRDPRTGELLPLDPKPQPSSSRSRNQPAEELALGVPYKRPRRRRHPVTGELMPLGWRYEPDVEGNRSESGAGNTSVESMRRLSIVREPELKRPRLASASVASSDPRAQSIDPLRSFLNDGEKQSTAPPKSSDIINELNSSDSDDSEDQLQRFSPAQPIPSSKTSNMQPNHKSALSTAAILSRVDSSPEPISLASFLKSSKTPGNQEASSDDETDSSSSGPRVKGTPANGKTSIMNPTGSQTVKPAEEDSDSDDLDEDEYVVESILDHHMSDPRSHPGKSPIMLYKTKWEGFTEPTWEPAESFPDSSVIDSYGKHVGLKLPEQNRRSTLVTGMKKTEAPSKAKVTTRLTSATARVNQKGTSVSEEDDDEYNDDDDKVTYEIERILAHHKSDPRTHPGKPIAMLYQTKWKGYPDPTWEPANSFTDRKMLHEYQRRVGLRA